VGEPFRKPFFMDPLDFILIFI